MFQLVAGPLVKSLGLAASDRCGHAVATRGNVAAFSCPYHDDVSPTRSTTGIIEVYERNETSGTWEFKTSLQTKNPATYDRAGYGKQSIAIENDYIAFGAV